MLLRRYGERVGLRRDFAIREAFHSEANDIAFALGHAILDGRINLALLGCAHELFHDVAEFFRVRPDLAVGKRIDGFAQHVEGAVAAENAIGAEAERFDDQFAIGRAHREQKSRLGVGFTNLGKNPQTGERAVGKVVADDRDARAMFANLRQNIGSGERCGYNVKSVGNGEKRHAQQIAVHLAGFGNKNRRASVDGRIFRGRRCGHMV